MKNKRSEWINSIIGKTCQHNWILNSTMMGLSDCSASIRIPLCCGDFMVLKYAVESMPHASWRKNIINVLADDKNLLRWIVLESVNKLGDDCLDREKTETEWMDWKRRYQDLFVAEYNIDTARKKAKSIESLIIEDYGKPDIYMMRKLNKDLQREER